MSDPIRLSPATQTEIAALARRMTAAQGPVMRAITLLGGGIENRLERLPDRAKEALEQGAALALTRAYHAAHRLGTSRVAPGGGPWSHRLAALGSGAAGGAGGLATALIELPATVTLIFGALQRIAAQHGFDPAEEDTRLTCLEVFASGGPGRRDDGVNSTFLGARLGVNGATLAAVVGRIAPRFAAAMGPKLASQMVPILGAAAGAGINYAFMDYYQEMAHVRFGLKRLARDHDEAEVLAAFRAALALRRAA